MILSLIAAMGKNRVIGSAGSVPWHLPDDLKFFETKTSGHFKLMGRKTYENPNFKPDPEKSILLTRDKEYKAGSARVVNSIEEGFEHARQMGEVELFIAGGAEVYAQTIGRAGRIYLTIIDHDFEGDSYFPEFNADDWELVSIRLHEKDMDHEFSFRILEYHRIS